jgi:twinkle protein
MNPTQRLDAIAEKLSMANLPDVDFDKYYRENKDDNLKIKRVVDFYDDIEAFIENGHVIHGAKLPFQKTHEVFRFRDGEVTLWTGYNGHRKSMLLGYASVQFLRDGQKVCIASFEMKPVSTIRRMTKQYTGCKNTGYDEFAEFMQFAGDNFYIFDHLGGINPQRLYGIILYSAQQLGVKHFVIDSLMRVIAGEDDHNAQKDFVVKLCELAIKCDIHIHLVHHVKKGKEGEVSGRYDAKGSGALSDNVHNSLVVWSNKDKNKDMPDVVLKCDKQREGEWEGKVALTFCPESLRFEQADFHREME